jgi:hypothetical protein
MKIFYVDGLCGSGKTHGLREYLLSNKSLHPKVIIITPTKELNRQIKKDFGDEAIKIDGDSSDKVVSDIVSKIKEVNALKQGIIIATHAAYEMIPFFENKHEWLLVVDEIPAIDSFKQHKMPYSSHILTDFFAAMPFNETMSKIVKKPNAANIKANTLPDDVTDIFAEVGQNMMKGHDVFTHTQNWRNICDYGLVEDDTRETRTQKNMVSLLTLKSPIVFNGHKDVIMMGAKFTESILFKWWKIAHGVDWVEFKQIKLRYDQYDFGNRVTINYMVENNWSKHVRNKKDDSGCVVGELFADYVSTHFKDTFLLVKNKDDQFNYGDYAKEIPVICHGRNDLSKYNKIAFTASLNRQPKHLEYLTNVGLDSSYVKNATVHEVAHQSVMRSSLRDVNSKDEVEILVMDKSTADSLACMFIGCKIKRIDHDMYKEVIGFTKTEQKLRERMMSFDEIREKLDISLNPRDLRGFCISNESTLQNSYFNQKFTYFDSKYASLVSHSAFVDMMVAEYVEEKITSCAIEMPTASIIDLIKMFKSDSTNNVIRNKEEVPLFTPATFDLSRSKNNIKSATLAVLDIDSGIAFDDMRKIFEKISFFAYSTFSHNPEENEHRYRLCFPLKREVTADEYLQITQYLANKIKNAGYSNTKGDLNYSGLDTGKLGAESMFYVPCYMKGKESSKFFVKNRCDRYKVIESFGINPDDICKKNETFLPKPIFKETEKVTYVDNTETVSKEDIVNGLIENVKHTNHSDRFKIIMAMKNSFFTHDQIFRVLEHITPFESEDRKNSWRKVHDMMKQQGNGKDQTKYLLKLAGIKMHKEKIAEEERLAQQYINNFTN